MSSKVHLGAIHGRFQPFHNGHLDYLMQAAAVADIVIVAITNPFLGSKPVAVHSDDHRHLTASNPLSYYERYEVIQSAVSIFDPDLIRRIRIVPLDLHAPASHWLEVVPLSAVQFVTPHEAWDEVKAARFAQAGYEVRLLATRSGRVTATSVRSLMREGKVRWRELVPKGTAVALESLGRTNLNGGIAGVSSPLEFWNKKHEKYLEQAWSNTPNTFAELVLEQIAPPARLLDLGCGTGRDSLLFARAGFDVVALDFAQYALDQFGADADDRDVAQVCHDLSETPYPFEVGEFDLVYAHLSLHYGDAATTARMFGEVARVLRPDGLFFALFNSIRDPEMGTGIELEPFFYEVAPGDRKHYFSVEALSEMLGASFEVVACTYGQGTKKNVEDQFVQVVARRAEGS